MEVKTRQINIFRKGLIPFKARISYYTFKDKLFIVEGGFMNFKRNLRAFWKVAEKYNLYFEDGLTSEVYKNYNELFKQIKRPRKELSREAYLKNLEGTRNYYKKKTARIKRAKNELNKMIEWL